jgi:hypothetical protein
MSPVTNQYISQFLPNAFQMEDDNGVGDSVISGNDTGEKEKRSLVLGERYWAIFRPNTLKKLIISQYNDGYQLQTITNRFVPEYNN